MGVLEGRVAIVTGAGSGIGQAIAIGLAAAGAKVVIDYIGGDEGANETLQKIEAAGGKAITCRADITKHDEIAQLIEGTWSAFGSCDILINNAGLEIQADFEDVTDEQYEKVLDVNLKGPFFLTQAFVRRLKAENKKGRIINISSVHEDMAFPGFTTYCMSKGGLRMMTRDLAVVLGPLGITINNVAPGAIITPINAKLLNDKEKTARLRQNIPLGYLGSVEDVSGIVRFLASDEAGYINGSTFIVDGGLIRSYHEQ